MLSNKTKLRTVGVLIASLSPLMIASMASGDSSNNYGPFPVTVKGYDGSATNSVSYSGQIARHVLHDSLKAEHNLRFVLPRILEHFSALGYRFEGLGQKWFP